MDLIDVPGYRKPSGGIPLSDLAAPAALGHLDSGYYYYCGGTNTATTSASSANGTLRLVPWLVPNAVTISKIGAEITSAGDAGSKLRIGIYSDTGTGYPGALLLDAGQIAGDSATVQEISISQLLPAGLYWVGAVVQSVVTTQPTIRCQNAPGWFNGNIRLGTSLPAANLSTYGFAQTGVTGALSGPFTSTITFTTIAPRILFKVA